MGLLLSACQYPSEGDVDRFVHSYANLPKEERTSAAKRFLMKLKSPESVDEDRRLSHAMLRFADLYRATRDESLLEAMDAVPIDGGFAMELCGVYKVLSGEPEMRQRYRATPRLRESLWRCQGLSFSLEELNSFFQGSGS
jgi:hypothetical protein